MVAELYDLVVKGTWKPLSTPSMPRTQDRTRCPARTWVARPQLLLTFLTAQRLLRAVAVAWLLLNIKRAAAAAPAPLQRRFASVTE